MKIALFGGTFDPVHIGHEEIIKKALKELDIDLLIVVPAFLNPFKKSFFAPPKLRLKWLKKVAKRYKNVKVCDYEIKNKRPTYAIETVQYLKKIYKPSKIYFIIGADNLKTLEKWHNYKKLKKEVEFVVAKRDKTKIPSKYKTIDINVPISATMLRKKPIKRFLPKIAANEILKYYKVVGRKTSPFSSGSLEMRE